ncbi:MAG: hypothetical protein R3258_03105 [Acidimicrobiia bacterium]|nr:hypothetical protein [Acidimicrobiia bacterium]
MPMSQEHKEALARGRREARAIKAYLKAIADRRPGRPVTRESLEERLSRVNTKLAESNDPLESVELIQARLDLEDSLARMDEAKDIDSLEAGFVAHVASYSERKGITYPAWREAGVPAAVLRKAGVPETRRRQ